jgi:hypothetical protein
MNMSFSRFFRIGLVAIFTAACFFLGGVLVAEAKDVGGQSPVMIVAPNYTDAYTTSGGRQALPGSSVYLTPDGYPVMRTPQGGWVYMVNPEAVRIPGPHITVIHPGVPLIYGYPYPQGMVAYPQGGVPVPPQQQMQQQLPQPPQGIVVPPVAPSSGQVYYYPTGAGGFTVQPSQ